MFFTLLWFDLFVSELLKGAQEMIICHLALLLSNLGIGYCVFIYSSKGGKHNLDKSTGVLASKAKFLWYSCEELTPEF